jgi:hypothetical protein
MVILFFIIVFIFAAAFFIPTVAINKHHKKVFSTVPQSAIDNWGRTPFNELEEWWEDNQSKDAQISDLKELVSKKSALIATQQKAIAKLQKLEPVKRGHDEYIQVPTPTFSDPSKMMVLPSPGTITPLPSYLNPATRIAGLRLEGALAEAIMSEDAITSLKVHNGKVVEWSVESFDRW